MLKKVGGAFAFEEGSKRAVSCAAAGACERLFFLAQGRVEACGNGGEASSAHPLLY